MKVAITGHREGRFKDRHDFNQARSALVSWLVELAPTIILSGMASGIDECAAWFVSSSKNAERSKLFAVWPFPAAGSIGPIVNAEWLGLLAGQHFIGEQYKNGCYHKRNRYLVDNCDLLVAVYDGKPGGGTAYTVDYARSVGREVRYVRW